MAARSIALRNPGALPDIGVLGGSGLYSLLEQPMLVAMDTPFGDPSDEIGVGLLNGVEVAFVPRHGRGHTLGPTAINYRANLWALKKLGVSQVIASATGGSLQTYIRPGDLVVCDQFVDRTWGRPDTYHDQGPRVAHVAAGQPYCPRLRHLALELGQDAGLNLHERGTVVVVQGPRTSTHAESRWYSAQGWAVVNMTQYPEVILARELEMCYVTVVLITEFDVGLAGDSAIALFATPQKVLSQNVDKIKDMVGRMATRMATRSCACAESMKDAFFTM